MLEKTRTEIQTKQSGMSIIVENVDYSVDGKKFLNNISCRIEEAGTTVLMGANGAGKSLFLRLIAGLLKPDCGKISISSKQNVDNPAADIALVFQHPVLLRRSAFANVAYVLKQKGYPKHFIAQKVDEALVRAKLVHCAQTPARQLSGGEQQRLAMARALAVNSSILLLDEATANLDPASTFIVENMVAEASQAGTKVIFITHDVRQAKRVGNDILFIHQGRILVHKQANEFFENPGSNEAQAYLDGRVAE